MTVECELKDAGLWMSNGMRLALYFFILFSLSFSSSSFSHVVVGTPQCNILFIEMDC